MARMRRLSRKDNSAGKRDATMWARAEATPVHLTKERPGRLPGWLTDALHVSEVSERKMISVRTKAALAAAKARGQKLGNCGRIAQSTTLRVPKPNTFWDRSLHPKR